MVNVSKKVLRWPEVHALTGVNVATAYRWMKEGKFPRPIKMGGDGPRCMSLWLADDIEQFLAGLIEARGAAYQTGPLEKYGRKSDETDPTEAAA
jgi:prophage regulatory protein